MDPAQSSPTRAGTADIAGCALEYNWYGPEPSPQSPTLVLLHEGLGCVEMWGDFPARLHHQTRLSLLCYSRCGYGKSGSAPLSRSVDYMHQEAKEVLPRLLDAFEIQNALLVGHSDGGSIALIHAGCDLNQRISGLILFAPHVFNEPLSVRSISEAARLYRETDLRDKLTRYHGEQVDRAFWGWNRVWLNPDFLEWNIEEYLSAIQPPLLLIQGREDQYGTLNQLEAIERQVAGYSKTIVLEACAHSPHRDQPEKTLLAITDFISHHL
ncbi:MAG: alpha/beta hydrolase [Arenicellales bacterium]|nr:alpha/beta hydrolase [Arenicellales bacterium]|tara:strand:- start:285 stop:1088 length:804 start_codon:yes stop_codon:yes gene_type:complete